jgi:hypothetical protein
MQLVANLGPEDHWHGVRLFHRFSSFVMVAVCMLLVAIVVLLGWKITKEWMFALRCRYSSEHVRRRFGKA